MAALHKKQKLEEEKMRTNDERYPRLLLRCCTLLTVLCSARVGVIVCSARNLAGAGGVGLRGDGGADESAPRQVRCMLFQWPAARRCCFPGRKGRTVF